MTSIGFLFVMAATLFAGWSDSFSVAVANRIDRVVGAVFDVGVVLIVLGFASWLWEVMP
jgi:hypothetical protein